MALNTLNSLESMTFKEYIAELEKFLDKYNGQLLDLLSFDFKSDIVGHAEERHIDLSDEQMVARAIKEVKFSSTFSNKEEAESFISEALYSKEEEIANWFLEMKEYTHMLSIDMREPVGRGVSPDFRGKDTPILKISLLRARDQYTCLGFVITTAYPDIKDKTSSFNKEDYYTLAEKIKGAKFTRAENIYRAAKADNRYEAFLLNNGHKVRIIKPLKSNIHLNFILEMGNNDKEKYYISANGKLQEMSLHDIILKYSELKYDVDQIRQIINSSDLRQHRLQLELQGQNVDIPNADSPNTDAPEL